MIRRALALLGAAALAGCPLPQPLPDYPPGTITPPRILVDGIAGHERSVVLVPAGCPPAPSRATRCPPRSSTRTRSRRSRRAGS